MIGTPSHRRVLLVFCLLVAVSTPGSVITFPESAEAAPEVVVDVPPMPDGIGGVGVVTLIRTSLLTLNDAVQTGNFTVLRDRGAPSFRDANSAARLGVIFSDLVGRRVDLSVVSTASPKLDAAPVLNRQAGTLYLKGHFEVTPAPIYFEVIYQLVDRRWQLYGLSVRVPEPVVVASRSDAPAPPQSQTAAQQPVAMPTRKPKTAQPKTKQAAQKKKKMPWQ